MLKQEYILLIMNCKKYKEKALQQKNTWLKNIPSNILYFHVIGDPLLDDDEGYSFDFVEKILYVQTEDDYISLPKKVFAAYKAILDTYQFKYIFKTDDDQLLINDNFLNTLMNILDKKEPRVHYGGNIVDVKVPYLSEYYKIHPELPKNMIIHPTKYCSGRFYFLSWDAIFSLSGKKESIEKEYMEDYAIGLNLSSFLKETVMNLTTDKYFIDF
jgi:hypothetical protein